MSARRYVAGLAVAAAAVATLASTPAQADPAFTPKADDIVGVGSDTSQFALAYLANGTTHNGQALPGYNAGRSSARLASFDATGGGTVVLQEGSAAITRPNGSGAGKGLLYGPGNNTQVDYARSSSALNAAEVSNGLFAFPFALDVLEMATAKTTNAPVNLTEQQILKIYTGEITNWNQVGGTAGTIVPMIPQSGSGTRSFFESELKRINGGSAANLASSVIEVQEHDDTQIKNNANAVAPFSAGRANLEGTVRLVGGGFSAKRALYNVVRQADLENASIKAIFSSTGYVCSDAARPLIEAAGFDQLARVAGGGVCGEPTQAATSNFATNEFAVTATTLTATALPGAVTLKATVEAGGNAADGVVAFYEGDVQVGQASLAQGQAVLNLTNVTPGQHTYTARFAPAVGAPFEASESVSIAVTVKAAATGTVTLAPASTSFGKAAKATVTLSGVGEVPTGTVKAAIGSATVSGTLNAGKAVLTLPATVAAGSHTVKVAYAGDAVYAAGSFTAKLTVAKATSKVTASFPKTVKKGAKVSGTVKVALPGASVKATGKVTVKLGKKTVGTATVKNGVAKLKFKLAKGKKKLVVVYAGTGSIKGATVKATVTQK
ncbi:Ig-like domain repeat protein [Nocardioides sp. Bht2]|uniref:Ig-like domain repeat protein n=1 Tax=Nocardioides sp. Bht2 TaxID=3392297 RepID=UPI0039B67CAB